MEEQNLFVGSNTSTLPRKRGRPQNDAICPVVNNTLLNVSRVQTGFATLKQVLLRPLMSSPASLPMPILYRILYPKSFLTLQWGQLLEFRKISVIYSQKKSDASKVCMKVSRILIC